MENLKIEKVHEISNTKYRTIGEPISLMELCEGVNKEDKATLKELKSQLKRGNIIYLNSPSGVKRMAIYEIDEQERFKIVGLDTVNKGIAENWSLELCKGDYIHGAIGYYVKANIETVSEDLVNERLQLVREKEEATRKANEEAKRKREEQAERGKQWIQDHNINLDNYRAIIIAELREDQSDPMTDYYGYDTVKTVLLALSTHTRDLFPEMRKSAGKFEGTKHLQNEGEYYPLAYHKGGWNEEKEFERYAMNEDLQKNKFNNRKECEEFINKLEKKDYFKYEVCGEDYEHREKWSMGAGYYLGRSKYSGWIVEKSSYIITSGQVYYLAGNPETNFLLTGNEETREDTREENKHGITFNKEKNGIELRFTSKPEANILENLKMNGFRWSFKGKFWYSKRNEAREQFANTLSF